MEGRYLFRGRDLLFRGREILISREGANYFTGGRYLFRGKEIIISLEGNKNRNGRTFAITSTGPYWRTQGNNNVYLNVGLNNINSAV